ncbi:hypothetical protein [Agromyces sp. NPDC056965]|uniref:hypothetical protein n=1 Tax=Agromyces sp. NPDC056965 TaxID=3345983 RepID=UPI003641BB91
MRSDPPTGDELTRLLVSMKHNVLEQVANEPAPAPAKRTPRADRIIGLTLGVLLLLGVGTGAAFAFGVVPFGGEPGAAPVATSTPTPSATPTPTPTPTPSEFDVEPGQPASRYGLDCATLIDDSVASGLFTTEVGIVDPIVTASGAGINILRPTSILSEGGTVCEWSNGVAYNSQYGWNPAYVGVTVSILPRPAEGWSVNATNYGFPRDDRGCGEAVCFAIAAVGDAWVEIEALAGEPNAVDSSGWDPFVDGVIAAVSAAGPAAGPSAPAGVQLECDTIIPIEAVRAATAESEAVPHGRGGGGWSQWAEARWHAGDVGCSWGLPDLDATFAHVNVAHGGRWAFERMLLAGSSTPVSLGGLHSDDEAVVRCDDEYGTQCAVDLRIGQDWFNVSGADRAAAIALSEALLVQLAR